MKTHSTNYFNTFIVVADDCPIIYGENPPVKGDVKTVANLQFDLISANPYKFNSDEVLFKVFAERNDLTESELDDARLQFFAKGQPCFRASPLTKRYGWGVHYDADGKIAIFSSNSEEYQTFVEDSHLKILKAMKSSK
jgi:hypothetical protein